ncbi:hypothetical protein [Flavobacterium sp.]|uniref:hypothetical protein n=1 Tax=Flavobacterium sp. TaxID=239 RepID=UPI002869FA63|nr:hypothetical protein [Flavobacterium sp.]
MKKIIIALLAFSVTSCVVLKKSEYKEIMATNVKSNARISDEIKDELHNKMMDSKMITDCDFTFLLEIISKRVYQFKKIEIDDERVNFIKDELIKLYDQYKQQPQSLRISENELKKKVSFYLDYMLKPKNEKKNWFDFEDNYIKKPKAK